MISSVRSYVASKVSPKALSLALAAVWLIGLGFLWGRAGPSKELASLKANIVKAVAQADQKSAEVTAKVTTQYVDRIVTVKEKGEAIEKKVTVYVPRDVCELPASFRSLHNAAATGGSLPEPP